MPLWDQFAQVPPPHRFIVVADALREYLRANGYPDLTQRRLSTETGKSHSTMGRLSQRYREGQDTQPEVETVRAIVQRLNELLARTNEPQWPILDAMRAAGYESAQLPAWMYPLRIVREDEVSRAPAYIAAPVFDIDRIATRGMSDAVRPGNAINFNADMGVIVGQIPGYPNAADEMVLFQRPENVRGIGNAYALVRVNDYEVRAVSRKDLTAALRPHIIAWLLGVLRFPAQEKPPLLDGATADENEDEDL